MEKIAYEEQNENRLENYEILYQYSNHELCITQEHYHRLIEMLYCISGKQRIIVDEKEYLLKPGDLIIIPPNIIHSVYSIEDQDHKYAVMKFHPEAICSEKQSIYEFNAFFSSLFYLPGSQIFFSKKTLESTDIPELISKIFSEEATKDFGYKFSVRIKISEIFLQVMRMINRTSDTFEENERNYRDIALVPPEIKARFTEIFNFIDEHFGEDLTAEQIMNIARMSHTAFSLNLKIMTGKTFKEYLNYVRIGKSKKLLATTQKTVAQIARECGFSSSSYFSKLFQERIGCTPLKFKREMKKNPLTANHYNLKNKDGKNHYTTDKV